jgi:hypothetical protein
MRIGFWPTDARPRCQAQAQFDPDGRVSLPVRNSSRSGVVSRLVSVHSRKMSTSTGGIGTERGPVLGSPVSSKEMSASVKSSCSQPSSDQCRQHPGPGRTPVPTGRCLNRRSQVQILPGRSKLVCEQGIRAVNEIRTSNRSSFGAKISARLGRPREGFGSRGTRSQLHSRATRRVRSGRDELGTRVTL